MCCELPRLRHTKVNVYDSVDVAMALHAIQADKFG